MASPGTLPASSARRGAVHKPMDPGAFTRETSCSDSPTASRASCRSSLRQPGGFMGLGVIPEILDDRDPASAQRVDGRPLQCKSRAVACGTPDARHYYSISSVNEIRFGCVGLPGLAELLELPHDRLQTHERPRLRPTLRVAGDHVGIV